jgi:hypothetical protein
MFSFCFQQLRAMTKVMKDCWFGNPSARLTALRVKKTVAGLVTLSDKPVLK